MELLTHSNEPASIFHHFSLEKLPASEENAELIRILLDSSAFTFEDVEIRKTGEREKIKNLPHISFKNLLQRWLEHREDMQHEAHDGHVFILRNDKAVVEVWMSLATLYASMISKTGIGFEKLEKMYEQRKGAMTLSFEGNCFFWMLSFDWMRDALVFSPLQTSFLKSPTETWSNLSYKKFITCRIR